MAAIEKRPVISVEATSGARVRRIIALALPIIGGMMSQNLLNLVDTAMVAVLGDAALAAVGIASFANFMATAFIMGMAVGVQATAARWLGAGRSDTATALNGGLLLALAVSLPLTALLVTLTPWFSTYLMPDPAVRALGQSYLGIRLLGIAAVGMNFAFRGYWNAIHLSRLYMGTLILMHVVQIALNWVLIFGHLGAPALGVTGAALSNVTATWIGTACYFALGLRHARGAGFLAGVPARETLLAMLRTSLPAGVQQFFFAAGMTAFFWIVGRIGTGELAAANVLINVMLVAILPAIGFGLTAATLVGQSLGAGDRAEAAAWAWRVGRVAVCAIGLLMLPALLAPRVLLGLFLHDPVTLELARLPLQISAVVTTIDALGAVLMNAHLGAGSGRRVMVVSIATQWGLFLPAAYLLGPVLGFGLVAVWCANGAYRMVTLLVFVWSWRQGRWADVRL